MGNLKLVGAVAAAAVGSSAMAGTVWSQGFETDTTGWFGDVTRVASGTGGIASAEGGYHAIATDGDGSVFTRFDGYRSSWPGGFTASIDVYMDLAMAVGEGFDYSVAASGSDGGHQRDFILHATRSAGGIQIGASNNTNFAPRMDLGSLANNYLVTTTGWYTIEQVFRDAGDGTLAVDVRLLDSIGTVLFSETRNDPTDIIATEVGGNRYGWFTFIDVAGGVAIDGNTLNIAAVPLPTGAGLAFAGVLAVGARRRRAL